MKTNNWNIHILLSSKSSKVLKIGLAHSKYFQGGLLRIFFPMANGTSVGETKFIYYIDEEETPYLVKLNIAPEKVTLGDFKNALNRPHSKFFFKSLDDDFGLVIPWTCSMRFHYCLILIANGDLRPVIFAIFLLIIEYKKALQMRMNVLQPIYYGRL